MYLYSNTQTKKKYSDFLLNTGTVLGHHKIDQTIQSSDQYSDVSSIQVSGNRVLLHWIQSVKLSITSLTNTIVHNSCLLVDQILTKIICDKIMPNSVIIIDSYYALYSSLYLWFFSQ